MTVRPIGVLRMVDQNREDEKILAVGLNNPVYKEVSDYRQIYPHLLREIEHFFSIYKQLEAKSTKIVGWEDVEDARKIVIDCGERYRRKNAVA